MNQDLTLSQENLDQDVFWQAICQRDTRFKGKFVYGVLTTRIYCSPGCPSRQPNRENTTFFLSAREAETAGFRPCKRCRPHDRLTPNEKIQTVEKACKFIDDHIHQPPSLEIISKELNLSASYLHKIFKEVMGLTPRQFAAAKKLDQFKSHVKKGGDVTTALYNAGYSSASRLYEGVSQKMGMTPAAYREGGAGKRIIYTITRTPLGLMLVASTEKGICAVSFGQDVDEMKNNLQHEYSAAIIQYDEDSLTKVVDSLIRHLEGSLPHLELSLDLQATAFQMRVWEELRKIPYGETRTYAQVAQAIGHPKAVRAVANACAANPVVVVTPCHRVVRSDGSLGGYHYGVERKKALLQKEKEHEFE